jgi:tRNA pseudouridine38-40 synthase
VIAYFGAPYLGWQKTKMGPSIEETLEKTLQKILQQQVVLQAASRTDAGVHAEGQVVNFFLNKPICLRRLKHSLNGLLPKEISVVSAEVMKEDFHPTLDCVKKEYWYHICNEAIQSPFFRETSWHFPFPIDLEQMQKGAEHLLGSHDFSAFCNERQLWDRNTICLMEKIEILPIEQNRFCISMIADHFLYKMARNIAGTLAYVGCGKISADAIPSILNSQDRTQSGITAPAHGLKLKRIFYNSSEIPIEDLQFQDGLVYTFTR